MTAYHPHGVKLSAGQRKKLAKACKDKSAMTIRLSNNELSGGDQLMLTKTQIARLNKAKSLGKGSDIKISKAQISKVVVRGGSHWSSLFSLGARMLPYASKAATTVLPYVAKAVPALATGALGALGSLGISKLFGKKQEGGFLIPQNKIDKLIANKHLLSAKQKKDILDALQTGSGVVVKPTKTQSGGFLGTLLASIGIPLLMNALTGKGLHVEKSRPTRSRNVYVPPTQGRGRNSSMMMPWQPPPFIGSWKNPIGLGIKKKEGKRSSARSKQSLQQHSVGRSHFINKPLSNHDLKKSVKQLGIKYFRGVFSKDLLPTQIKKKECGIINLDNHIGPDTHWVAYRNIDRFCEYFDSFGLKMPLEVKKYMATSGKRLVYSTDEIQERDSVLCGYWCLYYLLERQKGRSILDTIHNAEFDMSDTSVNHRFIINYFKNI